MGIPEPHHIPHNNVTATLIPMYFDFEFRGEWTWWLQYIFCNANISGTFVGDNEVELWFFILNMDNCSVLAVSAHMHSLSPQDSIVILIRV